MVISDFAIKRPMITVVTMVALVIFGLFALAMLQTDEFPDIQAPVVLVGIPYPGGSPEGVEREVLKPVEDAIKGISGVDKMYGTATDGSMPERKSSISLDVTCDSRSSSGPSDPGAVFSAASRNIFGWVNF